MAETIKDIILRFKDESGDYVAVHPQTKVKMVEGLDEQLTKIKNQLGMAEGSEGEDSSLLGQIQKLETEKVSNTDIASLIDNLGQEDVKFNTEKLVEALADVLVERPIFLVTKEEVTAEEISTNEGLKEQLPSYREGEFKDGDRVYVVTESGDNKAYIKVNDAWVTFTDSAWKNTNISLESVNGLSEAIESQVSAAKEELIAEVEKVDTKVDTVKTELEESVEGVKTEAVEAIEATKEELNGKITANTKAIEGLPVVHVGEEAPETNEGQLAVWLDTNVK